MKELPDDLQHDSLTGLPNRAQFRRVMAAEAGRGRWPPGVMLMDVDRFNEVNATLGHQIGDLLLIEIASRLRTILDQDHAVVARLGDDEFAVFLRSVADVSDAETIARLVLSALERPFALGTLPIEVGASIGLATGRAGGGGIDLLQRADIAMREAKVNHIGYAVYAPQRDHANPQRLSLAAELRAAIQHGELSVAYQPKADLASARIVGVEALVRWTHPRYGPLPPDEFIPLAEHTGLIRPLTELVLERALQECRAWSGLGHELSVAVNLSARSLLDRDLPATIERWLEQTGVAPRLLTLEITESMMLADPVRALDTTNRLAAMGVSLSIDDFGTGYSSLAYLRRLPVEEVKIDKSFVLGMTVDDDDATIVRSIIDLAGNLRLRVVAEGVEDGPALAALAALGCDVVQGFFLSRPIQAAALSAELGARGTALVGWVPSWRDRPPPPREADRGR